MLENWLNTWTVVLYFLIAISLSAINGIRWAKRPIEKNETIWDRIWEGFNNAWMQFFGFILFYGAVSKILLVKILGVVENPQNLIIFIILFLVLIAFSWCAMIGRGIEAAQAIINILKQAENIAVEIYQFVRVKVGKGSK